MRAQNNHCYHGKTTKNNAVIVGEVDRLGRKLETSREKYEHLEATFKAKRHTDGKTGRRAECIRNDNRRTSTAHADAAAAVEKKRHEEHTPVQRKRRISTISLLHRHSTSIIVQSHL